MMELHYPVFSPVEDLALQLFRGYFEGKDIYVTSLFEEGMPLPAVVARQDKKSGKATIFSDDPRWYRPIMLNIDTICYGPDADEEAALLQEAVMHAVLEAQAQQIVFPGCGHISRIDNLGNPSRVSDWATTTGVVQYAALPQNAVRYENAIKLFIRPDTNQDKVREANPFLKTYTKE